MKILELIKKEKKRDLVADNLMIYKYKYSF